MELLSSKVKRLTEKSISFAGDSIKFWDRYPKLITFTYKRKEEFKTLIGGFISFCTFVVLFLYAYLVIRILIGKSDSDRVEKGDTNKNITSTVKDLIDDNDPISLKGSTFMFGFLVDSDKFDILNDETYIDMTVAQYTYINSTLASTTTIPLEMCTNNHFPQINPNLLKKMKIEKYICPKSNNLTVLGNKFSENFTYFEISLKRCEGTDAKGNTCKSDININNALNNAYLTIAIVNTYYDFDDFSNPVKTYFDDKFSYDFVAGFEKETDIYIRQNSVEQKDNIFRYTPKGDESNFIEVDSVFEKFSKEDNDKVVMSARFYKDSRSDSYTRQVFSILDCCGLIGGVNEIST